MMNPENNEWPPEQVRTNTTNVDTITKIKRIISRPKIEYLAHAILLSVVGFGVCSITFELIDNNGPVFIIPGIIYLIGAFFALSSIYAVFHVNPTTGTPYSTPMKVFITIVGLHVGCWNLYCGFLGVAIFFGASVF